MNSRLVCARCGTEAPPSDPYPFRCPDARHGDDADHVLVRHLGASITDGAGDAWRERFRDTEPNPFLRYRALLHSHEAARLGGLSDARYVEIVTRLDDAIAQVDGRGFRVTPLTEESALARAAGHAGALFVKNETSNVSGSHKGRHLMGIMIWLKVMEALGRVPPTERDRPLAIASCGNAALAAAVVAKAACRALEVFIPTDAAPATVDRLRGLGARLTVCPRDPALPGDPAYHAFRQAVARGALPFTCQGNENGLTIDGGKTLGWELVTAWLDTVPPPDDLYLQVGGGALGSALAQSLREAHTLGLLERLPALHTVQTASCHPLERAHARLVAAGASNHSLRERLLHDAARSRSGFMQPWPSAPHSIAHGILDDETYDWVELLRGVLETSGRCHVVDECALQRAVDLAHANTTIDVDPTGAAGFAGLLNLPPTTPPPTSLVLFTGVTRGRSSDT